MPELAASIDEQDSALSSERGRLVRLCTRLTGDRDVAEDLTQEALLKGWRHAQQLRDSERRAQWVSAIARNECRRWLQRRNRDLLHLAESAIRSDADEPGTEGEPADDYDLEVELERDELATLLDRAMAALPSETRRVLVERYVHESPQAEIARRLGLSEGAVEARIQRGKLTLRRVLTSDLRQDAAAYGLIPEYDGGWQQTRIWCPICGRCRLTGRFEEDRGQLQLRCARCCGGIWGAITNGGDARLFHGIHGFRAALNRVINVAAEHYRLGPVNRTIPCFDCGRRTPIRVTRLHQEPPVPLQGRYFVTERCPACGCHSENLLVAHGMYLPEGRRFWRDHPRLVLLPERVVETDGGRALVSGFQDVTGSARLDVALSLDTLQVIGVYGGGGG